MSSGFLKFERWQPNSITHHLYFESSLSPETFAVYNINEKHALDNNLNASRVQHFVRKLQSQFAFVPDEILPRMEKILSKLHYGKFDDDKLFIFFFHSNSN